MPQNTILAFKLTSISKTAAAASMMMEAQNTCTRWRRVTLTTGEASLSIQSSEDRT